VIDFRYHLVSIIAVFLALAVGLVVGATALAPATEALLKTAENELTKTNASLSKGNRDLRDQVNADQQFAQAAAPRMLTGLLTGVKVVLVISPNADSAVTTGVTAALQQAGATVTGDITLNLTFLSTDGQNEDQLTQLAQNLAGETGVTLPSQLSGPVAGQQAAAKVLSASLLTGGDTALSAVDSKAILSGFSQGGYLSASIPNGAATLDPASLAVLVAPGGPAPQTGSRVLVALAVALRNAGNGAVMAGAVQSVGAGSVISAEDSAGQVSTVDNADTATGQIETVQALRLLFEHGAPKQYGIGPNAAPSPAPTSSVTPGTTPPPRTRTTTGGHK
jgi:hypothetical protein